MKSSTFIWKIINTTSAQEISVGLLILRVGISFSMIYLHGYPKLLNFSEFSNDYGDPFGVGNATSLGLVLFAEYNTLDLALLV